MKKNIFLFNILIFIVILFSFSVNADSGCYSLSLYVPGPLGSGGTIFLCYTGNQVFQGGPGNLDYSILAGDANKVCHFKETAAANNLHACIDTPFDKCCSKDGRAYTIEDDFSFTSEKNRGYTCLRNAYPDAETASCKCNEGKINIDGDETCEDYTFTLTPSSNTIPADGTTTSKIRIVLAEGGSGMIHAIGLSTNNGIFASTSSQSATLTTDGSGSAEVDLISSSSTTDITATVTATVTTDTGDIEKTTTITFQGQAPPPTKTIDVSPTEINVEVGSTVELTLTLTEDAAPAQNIDVTVGLDNNIGSISENLPVTTDASGQARVHFTATVAGTTQLQATAQGFQPTTIQITVEEQTILSWTKVGDVNSETINCMQNEQCIKIQTGAFISQEITIPPDKDGNYIFSFDAKGDYSVIVEENTNTHNTFDETKDYGDGWKRYELQLSLVGTDVVTIKLQANTGDVYFDNIQLAKSDLPNVPFYLSNYLAGCCDTDKCWNGYTNGCTADGLISGSFKCNNGNWEISGDKFDWDYETSGLCPEDECYYGNNECKSSGFYENDHYCDNGAWTSRTNLVAQSLLDIYDNNYNGQDYTLFCDVMFPKRYDGEDAFEKGPFDNCLENTQRKEDCWNGPTIFRTCILKFGETLIGGTSLGQDETLDTNAPVSENNYFEYSLGIDLLSSNIDIIYEELQELDTIPSGTFRDIPIDTISSEKTLNSPLKQILYNDTNKIVIFSNEVIFTDTENIQINMFRDTDFADINIYLGDLNLKFKSYINCLSNPHYADDGQECIEISKISLLAGKLAEFATENHGNDFTLYCDDYNKTLNNPDRITNHEKNEIQKWLNDDTFCVLKYGTEVAFGANLNGNNIGDFVNTLFTKNSNYCNGITSDGEFHKCNNDNKFWWNPRENLFIYSYGGFNLELTTFDLIKETAINFILNPIRFIIDFISNIILTTEQGPIETTFEFPALFDKIYFSSQFDKKVNGTLTDNGLFVTYNGFKTNLCEYVDLYREKALQAGNTEAIGCCYEPTSDSFNIITGDNLVASKRWNDLTSKLRLEQSTGTLGDMSSYACKCGGNENYAGFDLDFNAGGCQTNFGWGTNFGDAALGKCWQGKCCGDDTGENYISTDSCGNNEPAACCSDSNNKVDLDGNCVAQCPTYEITCENYYAENIHWPGDLATYDESLKVACDTTIVDCLRLYDAAYNGICYSGGVYNLHRASNTISSGFEDSNDKVALTYNSLTPGRWIDCDTTQNHCSACDNVNLFSEPLIIINNPNGLLNCNGANCWVVSGETAVFGEYNPGETECCGDDPGEHYVATVCLGSTGATSLCCNSAADKIYNGNCVATCPDVTGPTITIIAPQQDTTLISSSFTITINTDEDATCEMRIGSPGNSAVNFDTTGTTHNKLMSGISDGPKKYYYYCTDSAVNTNDPAIEHRLTIDATSPIITESTAVPTYTNDNTPDYIFNTNEEGTITYSGSCASTTTLANLGDNTITFNTLSDGTYSDCTITVTDAANNPSNTLTVNTFTVNTAPPIITEINPSSGVRGGVISIIGTNFLPQPIVTFDYVPVNYDSALSELITMKVPSVDQPDVYLIKVITPQGEDSKIFTVTEIVVPNGNFEEGSKKWTLTSGTDWSATITNVKTSNLNPKSGSFYLYLYLPPSSATSQKINIGSSVNYNLKYYARKREQIGDNFLDLKIDFYDSRQTLISSFTDNNIQLERYGQWPYYGLFEQPFTSPANADTMTITFSLSQSNNQILIDDVSLTEVP